MKTIIFAAVAVLAGASGTHVQEASEAAPSWVLIEYRAGEAHGRLIQRPRFRDVTSCAESAAEVASVLPVGSEVECVLVMFGRRA